MKISKKYSYIVKEDTPEYKKGTWVMNGGYIKMCKCKTCFNTYDGRIKYCDSCRFKRLRNKKLNQLLNENS